MFRQYFAASVYGMVIFWSIEAIAQNSPPPLPQARQITIDSLPDNIKLIVGEKEEFYAPRVRAIHALSANLPQDQIDACYEFLCRKIETQRLPDLQFNGLKNELVFALIRQNKKPEKLASCLVKIYQDKAFDITWRDYCVQFFGKWYPNAPDNEGRKEMIDGLWNALKNERHNRIAGAAASQLAWLARRYPDVISPEKASKECLEAFQDTKCANISKVPLIQALTVLGNKEILPSLRTIIEKEPDLMTRISAIGALGQIGDKSDISMLMKIAESSDMRLKKPAQAAIRKIEKRNK